MRTFELSNLVLAGLMAVSLTAAAGAQEAHVEQTISSLSETKAVPVTWKNFVRAESDKMFNSYVQMGAFGKFFISPSQRPSISKRWCA